MLRRDGHLQEHNASEAQQPVKVPRIGFLTRIDRATGATRFEEFRRGLRELSYIEGENISIDYRNAEGKSDRITNLPHTQSVGYVRFGGHRIAFSYSVGMAMSPLPRSLRRLAIWL